MKNFFFLLLLICFYPNLIAAHPVSFKGSVGIMPNYMHQRADIGLNYTFDGDKAVGLSAINIDDGENSYKFVIPRFNFRLFRQNELESQFNIYVSGGLGAGDPGATGYTNIQTDYETRRIYTLLLTERIESEGNKDFNWIRYRFGVAPYLADFDGIHTWLIGQVDYMPEVNQKLTLTPMIRLFYQNYLVEFGVSTQGKISLNGIFHF